MTKPIELYRFLIDATVYTWTSNFQAVVYNTETYTPESIRRTQIEQGREINRANIRVTLPRTNALAEIYLSSLPDWPASLTIYRQVGAGTDVYWKGRIVGSSADADEVEINCESAFTSLKRPGLRRRYQIKCDHALYHRGCWLDIDDWSTAATVDTNTGTTMTLTEAATEADGYFTNGIMRDADGVMRWITSHVGETITITREFPWGTATGGSVTLHPGCDRTKETCKDKFNNLLNHGGCPWIPSKNPMGGTSIL